MIVISRGFWLLAPHRLLEVLQVPDRKATGIVTSGQVPILAMASDFRASGSGFRV